MTIATAHRCGDGRGGRSPRPATGRRKLSLDYEIGDDGHSLHGIVGTPAPDATPLEMAEDLQSLTRSLPPKLRVVVHDVILGGGDVEDLPKPTRRHFDRAIAQLRSAHAPAAPKPGFKPNRHGHVGVKLTREGRFAAEISHQNWRIYLGTHHTVAEAARAYDAMAVKLGRPAVNFPDARHPVAAPTPGPRPNSAPKPRPSPKPPAGPDRPAAGPIGIMREVEALASIAGTLEKFEPAARARIMGYIVAAFALSA